LDEGLLGGDCGCRTGNGLKSGNCGRSNGRSSYKLELLDEDGELLDDDELELLDSLDELPDFGS
jgi:hypothetical protein